MDKDTRNFRRPAVRPERASVVDGNIKPRQRFHVEPRVWVSLCVDISVYCYKDV